MTHAEIKIQSLLGPTLDSRDEASKLRMHLKDHCEYSNNIVVDFSDVEFMSRSFADQFHKEKMERVKEAQVVILIKNASTQIIEILQAVSKTQNTRMHTSSPTSVYSYSKTEPLLAFLNTI